MSFVPVIMLNSSPDRCGAVPTPAEPKNKSVRSLANFRSSGTDLTPVPSLTTKMLGALLTTAIGAKSVPKSCDRFFSALALIEFATVPSSSV